MIRPGSLVAALVTGVVAFSSAAPTAEGAWALGLAAGSHAEATATGAPGAPGGVSAACVAPLLNSTMRVAWSAVSRSGVAYTVLRSTTSAAGPYTTAASGLAASPWTSGALAAGTYWWEVTATSGTSWVGPASAPAGPRTVSALTLLCG